MKIAVNEMFGPTVQGEGASAGRRAFFLRLAGCNLSCSWCDTPFTWDWTGKNGKEWDKAEEVHVMEVNDVLTSLRGMGWDVTSMLVITGGEPMLQHKAIQELLNKLPVPAEVEIETNGTIKPPESVPFSPSAKWRWVRFNVSPKISNSSNLTAKRFNLEALEEFSNRCDAIFKFVVSSADDIPEIDFIVEKVGISPETVWLMPEGTSIGRMLELGPRVAQWAIDSGYNFTSRLHVLTWGNERKR